MDNKDVNKTSVNNDTQGEPQIMESQCKFKAAIEKYINLLSSQMDAFPIIINTLAVNAKTCMTHYEKCIKDRGIKVSEGENPNEKTYTVPIEYGKEFERAKTDLSRSINAFSLIPKNTVVAMVSLYDAYLADLIECAYILKPELLNASEKEFSFSDIIAFETIDLLKKHVIEKDVESILRESHIKQFEILSKKFKVELTKDLPSYNDFIEITERRNLFVHTNGRVSSQYLKICKERPFDHKDADIQVGEELYVTPAYVEHCYNILFEIGVKLGQVIWRKLDNNLEDADDSLINIGYELIKSKKYQLACIILDFSCKPYVKHFNKVCEYVLCVNHALAYYLKGDNEKCRSIINSQDWSGTELKYRLAHKVLTEEYDDAIEIMKSIGKDVDMSFAYAEWPLFNNFRKTLQFKDTYKEIYGKDYKYIEAQPTKWEDVVREAAEMIKSASKSEDKKGANRENKERTKNATTKVHKTNKKK